MSRYINRATELARQGATIADLLVSGVHQQLHLVRRDANLIRPELSHVETNTESFTTSSRWVVEEYIAEVARLQQVLAAAASFLGRFQPEEVVAHACDLVVPLLAAAGHALVHVFPDALLAFLECFCIFRDRDIQLRLVALRRLRHLVGLLSLACARNL